jgi:hypothetical protein
MLPRSHARTMLPLTATAAELQIYPPRSRRASSPTEKTLDPWSGFPHVRSYNLRASCRSPYRSDAFSRLSRRLLHKQLAVAGPVYGRFT